METFNEWRKGERFRFPKKQIFDPNTQTVKNPDECQIMHIIGRLIFEDPTRLICSTSNSKNSSLHITLEKTFVPHVNLEKHIHQYYLSIDQIELYDAEGKTLLGKLDSKAAVLITQPNGKEAKP